MTLASVPRRLFLNVSVYKSLAYFPRETETISMSKIIGFRCFYKVEVNRWKLNTTRKAVEKTIVHNLPSFSKLSRLFH